MLKNINSIYMRNGNFEPLINWVIFIIKNEKYIIEKNILKRLNLSFNDQISTKKWKIEDENTQIYFFDII